MLGTFIKLTNPDSFRPILNKTLYYKESGCVGEHISKDRMAVVPCVNSDS